MRPPEVLVQITAPHFCASVTLWGLDDVVREAAPILRYMIGWKRDEVKAYCKRKGWKIKRVR
jgi:hypothetical protein